MAPRFLTFAAGQWCPRTIQCNAFAINISRALDNVYCLGCGCPCHATFVLQVGNWKETVPIQSCKKKNLAMPR